jgi:hypothetical protein
MQNLDDELGQLISKQRAHLAAGIFRNKIRNAYFDAGDAAMSPNECIREAIYAGALSLVCNRSVELRGLSHQELAAQAWEVIRPNAATLWAVRSSGSRTRHVVAVVTRSLADAALEFWKHHAGADAVSQVVCGGAKSS